MEWQLVDRPAHPPGKCMFCGSVTGPFVDTLIDEFDVYTADGVVVRNGRGYVCLGNSDFPGCLAGIAVAIGTVPPWIYTEEKRQALEAMRNEDARIQQERARIADEVQAAIERIRTAGPAPVGFGDEAPAA